MFSTAIAAPRTPIRSFSTERTPDRGGAIAAHSPDAGFEGLASDGGAGKTSWKT